MFFKKDKPEPKKFNPTEPIVEVKSDHGRPQQDVYNEKLKEQDQIIREMFKMMIMIADCKNYAYIQRQRDLIQNLLDKI